VAVKLLATDGDQTVSAQQRGCRMATVLLMLTAPQRPASITIPTSGNGKRHGAHMRIGPSGPIQLHDPGGTRVPTAP